MIEKIEIYPVDNRWAMQIVRSGNERITLENWGEEYPEILSNILKLVHTIKKPEDQALDRVMSIIEKIAPKEEIFKVVDLIPPWVEWEEIEKDQIRKYNDKIYKSIQKHTTQPDWTPDLTSSLWVEIKEDESQNLEIINWYEPTSEHNYTLGQLVRFIDNRIYESLLNNNVWSPANYPAGWKLRLDLE